LVSRAESIFFVLEKQTAIIRTDVFYLAPSEEDRYAMAPRHNDPKGGSSGKGKVTVVMFQLEGSDDALRDAIKVLGHGIEKLAPGTPIYKVIQAPPLAKANGSLAAGFEEEEAIDGEVIDVEEESAPEDEAGPGSAEKPKRRPPKAIPAVKGIDWDSGTPWKDYAIQKNPEGNPSRFVAVAGWFRNNRSLEVITPGHIVAAFDVMDWQKPENIPNTFAGLKTKRGGELFDKGEKTNEWVLSQRGINALDRLGKENSK
jgi:hypothetical protein